MPDRSDGQAGVQEVWLRVYDMAESNWWSSYLGVGIFHSGVEVHGIEWAYGMVRLFVISLCCAVADAETVVLSLS